MRHPRCLLLAVVPVLVLVALGTGTATAATRGCANVRGAADVVFAENMSCRSARRVLATWGQRVRQDGRPNRRVLGYTCRQRADSIEGAVLRCTRGRRSVRAYPNLG